MAGIEETDEDLRMKAEANEEAKQPEKPAPAKEEKSAFDSSDEEGDVGGAAPPPALETDLDEDLRRAIELSMLEENKHEN